MAALAPPNEQCPESKERYIASQCVKTAIESLECFAFISNFCLLLYVLFIKKLFPERLTLVSRVREVESSFPKDRQNLTQRCKRFATASTSTPV